MRISPTEQHRFDARAGESSPPLWSVGWREAIFEHYRVLNEDDVAKLLPEPLTLDRDDDGLAWLSVVSFRMTRMRWRDRAPLPFASTYAQVNIRVYVVAPDGTPGVFFLRNLVSNRLAARAGRVLYGMPYVYQAVRLHSTDERASCTTTAAELPHDVRGEIGNWLTGHEQDVSNRLFFLTERYPLFSVRRNSVHLSRMLHPPWPLRQLVNTVQTHGAVRALGLGDALEPYSELQFSPGVQVQMWPPRRLVKAN